MSSDEPPNHHPVEPRVLLVEDSMDQAMVLSDWLMQQRVQVTIAQGPDFASRALGELHAAYAANAPFHLCLLDLTLGPQSSSGMTLVRAIKDGFRDTHLVLLTGNMELLSEAVAIAGFVSCLAKPYSPSEIRRMLVLLRLPVPN